MFTSKGYSFFFNISIYFFMVTSSRLRQTWHTRTDLPSAFLKLRVAVNGKPYMYKQTKSFGRHTWHITSNKKNKILGLRGSEGPFFQSLVFKNTMTCMARHGNRLSMSSKKFCYFPHLHSCHMSGDGQCLSGRDVTSGRLIPSWKQTVPNLTSTLPLPPSSFLLVYIQCQKL